MTRLHPDDITAIARQIAPLVAEELRRPLMIAEGRTRVDAPVSSFAALRADLARQDVKREERRARKAQK